MQAGERRREFLAEGGGVKGQKGTKRLDGRVSQSEHALWGMMPLPSLLVSGKKTSCEATIIARVRIQR